MKTVIEDRATNPCFGYPGFKMYMRPKCAGLSSFLRLGESSQFS